MNRERYGDFKPSVGDISLVDFEEFPLEPGASLDYYLKAVRAESCGKLSSQVIG